MGASESRPSNCAEQPWWSIENETFSLKQPNLSEIFASISEPDEVRYATVREKILAKLRDRKYSASSDYDSEDQNTTSNNVVRKTTKKSVTFSSTPLASSSRSNSESEPYAIAEDEDSQPYKKQTLEEFREELRSKRLMRQNALNDLRSEMNSLREQLSKEREINRKLQNGEKIHIEKNTIAIETDAIKTCDICIQTDDSNVNEENQRQQQIDFQITRSPSDSQQINLKSQLAELQLSLQLANADNLSLTTELAIMKKQVASLKEVIACSRQMIDVRDEQVQQLKAKIRQIEESLADRELKIMSENLRQEYDRQLANIRNLRQLYEERARVSAAERENLLRQISIKKDELAVEVLKVKTLQERISTLENDLKANQNKLSEITEQRDDLYIENKTLKDEMDVINKLFSQMLTGFHGTNNLDIDRLTTMLEENRILLNEMATKETNSEGASLPKLLFDIVNQANESEQYNKNFIDNLNNNKTNKINIKDDTTTTTKGTTITNTSEIIHDDDDKIEQHQGIKVASAQEIIGNLPKVWRILIEFLNHQKVEQVQFEENGQSEECYKPVKTTNGSIKSEISVSKTYIKLKDLILEKKSLMKETNRLKTLNGHLERRLDEQEKRLSVVSLELTKTWHLVGKMQRQHRQLHTHEQILRYQLQQKKRLLTELKEELEYCRRKWAAAKAKNAESQLQCDDLRREFAKRKLQDMNNSGESGYSDGPISSDDETVPTQKRNVKDFLEVSRKVERRNSTSPQRTQSESSEIRCCSAPPITTFSTELLGTVDEVTQINLPQTIATTSTEPNQIVATASLPPLPNRIANQPTRGSGAIPKQGVLSIKLSRGKKSKTVNNNNNTESLEDMFNRLTNNSNTTKLPTSSSESGVNLSNENVKTEHREERIHRLEEQCKSLIAQVIETSENKEKLKIKLCEFQNELQPAQHPESLEEYLSKRRSSAKDVTKEVEQVNNVTENNDSSVCLTAREEEYMARRSERLKRLEEESQRLMSKLSKHSQRGTRMNSRIDALHLRFNSEDNDVNNVSGSERDSKETQDKAIEDQQIASNAAESFENITNVMSQNVNEEISNANNNNTNENLTVNNNSNEQSINIPNNDSGLENPSEINNFNEQNTTSPNDNLNPEHTEEHTK